MRGGSRTSGTTGTALSITGASMRPGEGAVKREIGHRIPGEEEGRGEVREKDMPTYGVET